MCAACRAEYDDPARPPVPRPARVLSGVRAARSTQPIDDVAAALRAGEIVAVKGLGGYHLAALASSEAAVATLRARKHREDKPFAVMVADVGAASELCEVDDGGGATCWRRRPDRSCCCRRAPTRAVAPAVAPRVSPSSA